MSDNQPSGKATAPISTTLKSPETWQRVIKVEIARDFFDSEFTGRLKKAAKNHQRPGFRKGRTPRAVVEREVGDQLRMETVDALVPRAWMTALVEHKLSPVSEPSLENLEFEDGNPLKFDLVVEVRPEVSLRDLNGIVVERRSKTVTEQHVTEVLVSLQESRSLFEKVDRASQPGDQITLDLIPGEVAGEENSEKLIADQKFILGAESNMPAFNEDLAGVEAGAKKDIEVVYPEDHPNATLKGQTVTFHCHVKEVAVKVLPEIDDELAKLVSGGKDLAALKEEIRNNLEAEAKSQCEQEMDDQIKAELIRRHELELPPSMVDKYLASGLKEMHQRDAQSGRPQNPEQDKEYLAAGRPYAEKALASMMLMEAIRTQEEIKVSAEEVDERIEEIATENGFEVEKYREHVNSGQEKENLEYSLLERKTYDFLLSRAVIEDVVADTDLSAAEEE